MEMTFDQFISWAIAQGSVAKYNDGQYKGECVSLINQLCWRVLNVPADSWGHAKDWGRNTMQRQYFTVLPPGVPLQPMDILVYGEEFGGGLGHIEIVVDERTAIYQNRNLNGRVRTGSILPGYYAVLRKEGEDMGRIQELEDMANNRQRMLDDIAKLYSVPAPLDGNSLPQLLSNINTEKKRIDELTGIVGTLESELKLSSGTIDKGNVLEYLKKNLK